jgi:glycine dehydrogenase subunit 1
VYLASLGPRGLQKVAELCWHKAHYAAQGIARVRGYNVDTSEFFHEFVVHCPIPADEINRRLFQRHGIIGGYPLSSEFPDRKNEMLLCCTEMNGREEIDLLVKALSEVGNA